MHVETYITLWRKSGYPYTYAPHHKGVSGGHIWSSTYSKTAPDISKEFYALAALAKRNESPAPVG